MGSVVRLPNIQQLVEPLLGTAYGEANCWEVVRLLIREGFGLDLAQSPEQAAEELAEIWYRDDDADPLQLVQPWDLFICANHHEWPVSDHVGLVVDDQLFVHARDVSTGVALERMRKWRPWLFQVARLRRLV